MTRKRDPETDRAMQLETLFPPGARVVIRDAEWLVRRTKPTGYGDVELHVTGLSELVRDRDAIFLHPGLDEAVLLDPRRTELVADPSPGYRRTRLYLESLLRRTPPTDTRIHLGHHAAIDASAYQLVPAAQALARTEPRLLLADAVGLGKTIEIGILLSELIRRGRGRRILVVALKSVLEQFQTELWARFTIPLVRLDSEGLTRIARELPSNANPFHHYDRVLVSIDTLKNDAKYARLLEQCRWDAVVIDECQHVAMRGSGSQRAGLAKLLARTTDALLLASATPHDGRPESFASLVELLDPTALPDREHYAKDDIRDLYVRRFKKDVAQGQDRFRERRLLRHEVPASSEEDALYAALHEATFETVRPEAVRPGGRGVLFRTLLLKSLLSSPAALAQTLDARTKRIERRLESTTTPELEAALRRDLDQLSRLRALVPADDAGSKAQALDRLLAELEVHPRSENRVVIFAERLETLRTLHDRLRQSGFSPDQIAIFHGALSDVDQRDLTSRFSAADAPLRVLLASDAAAEGLNLHHECHRLVHYDIPWSLITLEQRNGRIDRFGQRHAPEIHYLLARPDHAEVRGDLRVLEVLLDKERRAHDALGDVQWLLRCFSPEAEEERVGEAIDAGSEGLDALFDLLEAPVPEDDSPLAEANVGFRAEGEGFVAVHPEKGTRTKLFATDLAYLESALFELKDAGLDLRVEPHPELDGLVLHAPEDLERRLRLLPPELRPKKGRAHFKLSADRALVQTSYAKARARHEDRGFPEWQLLWPLHPVLEWVDDRVLAHFARHEAPTARLHRGIPPRAVAALVQGVLSNRASQPVLVDWSAYVVHDGTIEIVPLADFAARVGLEDTLHNDGAKLPTAALEPLRARLVDAAERHLRALRAARGDELRPELKRTQKRLNAWAKSRLAALQAREAELTVNGRALRKDQRARLDRERAEVEHALEAGKHLVTERLSTVDAPYLRLAAFFVGAEVDEAAAKALVTSSRPS